jgi:hypothetical protein
MRLWNIRRVIRRAYRRLSGNPVPKVHNGMNEHRDIPRFGADEIGPF